MPFWRPLLIQWGAHPIYLIRVASSRIAACIRVLRKERRQPSAFFLPGNLGPPCFRRAGAARRCFPSGPPTRCAARCSWASLPPPGRGGAGVLPQPPAYERRGPRFSRPPVSTHQGRRSDVFRAARLRAARPAVLGPPCPPGQGRRRAPMASAMARAYGHCGRLAGRDVFSC